VNSSRKNRVLWTFGISEEQEKSLREILSGDFSLRVWPADAVPDIGAFDADGPAMHIFSEEGYKAYQSRRNSPLSTLDVLPHVMLLPEHSCAEDLQYAVDSGCAAVLRLNLAPERFIGRLNQILENTELQNNLLRISREIFLEREIYEHKNSTLQFLVNFLTEISRQTQYDDMLRTVFSCLKTLFPVRSMQAALWDKTGALPVAHMFISAPEGSKSFVRWKNLLLEQMEPDFANCSPELRTRHLNLPDQGKKWSKATPADGYVLNLPLFLADDQVGLLSVLTDMERNLSRDQAQALNAALQFLAVVFHNAGSGRAEFVKAGIS
jgi:hypothetical protein